MIVIATAQSAGDVLASDRKWKPPDLFAAMIIAKLALPEGLDAATTALEAAAAHGITISFRLCIGMLALALTCFSIGVFVWLTLVRLVL